MPSARLQIDLVSQPARLILPKLIPHLRAYGGKAADKIVFSTTLQSVSTARTRIERNFDPGMIRQLKSATERDMTVGGADLAGQAIKAGLVDELQLFLVPIIVGGGKPALPSGVRSDLELLDTQRFASGAVYLRYRPKLVVLSLP